LDSSNFPARYKLLAPRFTPHLSHLCTHKLASLTVLRIINQKTEPEASREIVQAMFVSHGDHVLMDVLGDQVNGVSVVHKVLTSSYIDQAERPTYLEATKRVLIELKVIATQAYRRLIEEVGLQVPSFSPQYGTNIPQPVKQKSLPSNGFGGMSMPGLYGSTPDPGLLSMMAAMQLNHHPAGQVMPSPSAGGPLPQLQINPGLGQSPNTSRLRNASAAQNAAAFSPTSDPFNPFALRSPEFSGNALPLPPQQQQGSRSNSRRTPTNPSPSPMGGIPYNPQSPSLAQAGAVLGMNQAQFPMPHNAVPQQLYNSYMYQMFNGQNS